MSLETADPALNRIESVALPTVSVINSSKRLRIAELVLVTASAFAIPIISSVLRVSSDIPVRNYDSLAYAFNMCREVFALGLLSYIVFRQGRTWLGFSERLEWMDIIRGGLVVVVASLVARSTYHLIQYSSFFWTGTWISPKSLKGFLGSISVVSVSFQLLNPVYEELIVRAYVMTEVRELTSSSILAVLVSTILQTSYHLYQGWLRAAFVGGTFLVFSIYYAKTRRIGPIIAAHLFYDLAALLSRYF
jgi:membrane protease YdiL (CAAX protease family)